MNQPIAIGILLFNRIDFAKSMLEQIERLQLSDNFQIYINIDCGRNDIEKSTTDQVYDLCNKYESSLKLKINYQTENKGLKFSVLSIIKWIMQSHERFIILEDDLILSSKVIEFFRKSLEKFSLDPEITQISGFSYPNLSLAPPCIYRSSRVCSWGWASWKSKFPIKFLEEPERSISWIEYVRSIKAGIDMPVLIYRQLHKHNFNSWATLFNLYQIKQSCYTIYPSRTLVACRHDDNSTHGSKNISLWQSDPFEVDIDIYKSAKIDLHVWIYLVLFYVFNKLNNIVSYVR